MSNNIKRILSSIVSVVLLICCVLTLIGILGSQTTVEAAGHYQDGVYHRSFKEKLNFLGLKVKVLDANLQAKRDAYKKRFSLVDDYSEYASKMAVSFVNLIKDGANGKDINWLGYACDIGETVIKGVASYFGFGGAADGVIKIIDAILPGASPLSETAKLSDKMTEEFSKVTSQLTDIENEISELSNTVNEESNRVISELSSQLDALDARQYVRTFTFSGEGNFSYDQFRNFIFGTTDPDNIYYNQSYYNAFIEAVANGVSDEELKPFYDNLYNALMSTSVNGQSNYIMLYEYLTADKSISQYYYDFISNNRDLLNDDQTAEEMAVDYAKDKYLTAITAGALIQICNTYQMNYMLKEYGQSINGNSRYYFNQNTGEYVTYNEIVQNVNYINNNKNVLLQNLIKDIAYVTNMGDSYLVKESTGLVYVVTDYNEDTFGQVVFGQRIYINQFYDELVGDIVGFDMDDVTYHKNGLVTSPEIYVGESNFQISAYYNNIELFNFTFYVGATNTFNGGDGSEEYPYNISNASQLLLVANDLSANYRLISDINCAGVTISTLGDAKQHFNGVFDGNGHTITNLSISSSYPDDDIRPLYVGIFGYIENGVVKNLSINNANINSLKEIDNLQATVSDNYYYNGIISGYSEGIISNCSVKNSTLTVSRHNETVNKNINVYAGGIVGENCGIIRDCAVEDVTIDAKSYHSYEAEKDADNRNNVYVGGIAGESYGYIDNCGVNSKTSIAAFAESYCSAKKTTKYPFIEVRAGGIVGKVNTVGNITKVFSAASVINCSFTRKNNGAGNESSDHCSAKKDMYIPGSTVDSKLDSFDFANISVINVPLAEMIVNGEVENGFSFLLSWDNHSVKKTLSVLEKEFSQFKDLSYVINEDESGNAVLYVAEDYSFSSEANKAIDQILSSDFNLNDEYKNYFKKENDVYYYDFEHIDGYSSLMNVESIKERFIQQKSKECSNAILDTLIKLYDEHKWTLKIGGEEVKEYNIIGIYGFDSNNTNTSATNENYATIIVSYEKDGNTTLISAPAVVTIAKNEITSISVDNFVGSFKYGDTDALGKTAYIKLNYSAGNSELISAVDYMFELPQGQTYLKYGDNKVVIKYRGLESQFNIKIECSHDYIYNTVDATCAHSGQVLRVCSLCGEDELVSYTEKLSRHSLIVIDEAYDATCEHEGSTGRVYCLECGYVFVEESAIPKTSHSYVMSDSTEHICSVCGDVEAHQFNVKESLNDAGNIVFTYCCLECDYSYTEVDTNTITDAINSLPTLAVSDGFALNGGDLVTIYVQLLNNPGITGANFGIRYDDKLTLVNWLEGTIIPQTVDENNEVNRGWNFFWASADATYENGNLLALTFRVPYDADLFDKYDINVVYGLIPQSDGGFSLDDGSTEPKKFITRVGSIEVVNHLPGDANNDSSVDLMDAVYTARYLIGKIEEINERYADVNLDGRVNVYDVVASIRGLIGGYGVDFLNQEFEIVLNANGADIEYINLPVSIYGTNNIYNLPTPERAGYTFLGWNTRIYGDGGRYIESGTPVIYDNKQLTQTLYARWQPNKVTFDMNGATSDFIESVTYSTSNTEFVLPLPQKQYDVYLYYGGEYLSTKTFNYDFKYWLDESTGQFYFAGEDFPLDIVNGGTTILKAEWEPISVNESLSIDRLGYEFGGFYYVNNIVKTIVDKNGDFSSVEMDEWISSTLPSDRKLYATYTPVTRTITLDSNGGECEVASKNVEYDKAYTGVQFPVPKREGYTFTGWYTENGGKIVLSKGMIDTEHAGDYFDLGCKYAPSDEAHLTNFTLYAHWSANFYSVSFNGNANGDKSLVGDLGDITVTYDSTYNMLPQPSRTGYSFDGWFTSSDGGIKIENSTKVLTDRDQTLYAHWSANTYKVIFNASENGGKCNDDEMYVIYNSYYGELPIAEKTGYEFLGWFTAKDSGTQIVNDTIVKITEKQILYARFATETYTVIFDANGGNCQTNSKPVVYDNEYETLPTPTRTGFDFEGWWTEKEGGEKVTENTVVKVTKDQTLYAHWKLHEYTIKLNVNSGSDEAIVGKTSFKICHGNLYSDLPQEATRTGFDFDGWWDSAVGGNRVYATDKFESYHDITLYAHWKEKTISVTFVPDNGLSNAITLHVQYGGPLGVQKFTKEGYEFGGWFTSENGAGVQITDSDYNLIHGTDYIDAQGRWIYVDGDLILYPYWKSKQYTVVYNGNKPSGASGEVTGKMDSSSYYYGESKALCENKFKLTGWEFKGWKDQNGNEYTDKQEVSNLVSNGGTIYMYAVWEAITYNVIYDSNKPSNASGDISCRTETDKMANDSMTYDNALKWLTRNKYELVGWEFKGWALSEEDADKGIWKYEDGVQVTDNLSNVKDSEVTLYAVWAQKTYTFTLDANGGTTGMNSTTVTYDDLFGNGTPSKLPEELIRVGFIFAGWYTETTGGDLITNDTRVTIEGGTLYAHWKVNPYEIGKAIDKPSATVQDTDGENKYKIYKTIDITPYSNDQDYIYIMDWSNYTGTWSYENEIANQVGNPNYGRGNSNHNIVNVSEVYFIGSGSATFTDMHIYIVNYGAGSAVPTIHFKDFNISSSDINIWNGEGLASPHKSFVLDVNGNCSITAPNGSCAIGGGNDTFSNVKITGNGTLTLGSSCNRGKSVQVVKADNLTFENTNINICLKTTKQDYDLMGDDVFYGWYSDGVQCADRNAMEYRSIVDETEIRKIFYPKWYDKLTLTYSNYESDDLLDIGGTEKRYIFIHGGSGTDSFDVSKYTVECSATGSGGHSTLTYEGPASWVAGKICGECFKYTLRIIKDSDAGSGTVTIKVTDKETNETTSMNFNWSTNGCFTGDTLVLNADMEYVRLDSLKQGDVVMSWNPITGRFEAMPISLYWNHGDDYYNLIKLNFSNGKTVKVVTEHGFFDCTLNKIVYINEKNFSEYIGHSFAYANVDIFENVVLESAEASFEYTSCYSLRTAFNDNAIVEGFLTLTFEDIPGFLTYFEYGDNYTYNAEKMAQDIETYGLFEYDEWKDYVSYEEFMALNGPYLKVAVGKGYLTIDDIFMLIAGMR